MRLGCAEQRQVQYRLLFRCRLDLALCTQALCFQISIPFLFQAQLFHHMKKTCLPVPRALSESRLQQLGSIVHGWRWAYGGRAVPLRPCRRSRTVLCLPTPQHADGAQALAVAIAGDRMLRGRRERYVLHLDVASRIRVFGPRSQSLIRGIPAVAPDDELA